MLLTTRPSLSIPVRSSWFYGVGFLFFSFDFYLNSYFIRRQRSCTVLFSTSFAHKIDFTFVSPSGDNRQWAFFSPVVSSFLSPVGTRRLVVDCWTSQIHSELLFVHSFLSRNVFFPLFLGLRLLSSSVYSIFCLSLVQAYWSRMVYLSLYLLWHNTFNFLTFHLVIYFMGMNVLLAHACVMCMPVAHRGEKRLSDPPGARVGLIKPTMFCIILKDSFVTHNSLTFTAWVYVLCFPGG